MIDRQVIKGLNGELVELDDNGKEVYSFLPGIPAECTPNSHFWQDRWQWVTETDSRLNNNSTSEYLAVLHDILKSPIVADIKFKVDTLIRMAPIKGMTIQGKDVTYTDCTTCIRDCVFLAFKEAGKEGIMTVLGKINDNPSIAEDYL